MAQQVREQATGRALGQMQGLRVWILRVSMVILRVWMAMTIAY
jgi:hypothetical protein